jgi:cytochrome c5
MHAARKARKAFPLGIFLLTTGLLLAQNVSVNGGRGQAPGQVKDNSSAANTLITRGRVVFGESCIQCHNMNTVLIQRKPEEGWKQTVYSMVSRGAQLTPDEMEALIAYLTATYGPDSPRPNMKSESGASAGNGGEESLPSGPGKQALSHACAKCHTMSLVTNSRKSEAEWDKTIARMVSIGAALAPTDRQALAEYLAKNFGEKK